MSVQRARWDFEITKGTSFDATIEFTNDDDTIIDLTGFLFKLIINLMNGATIEFINSDFTRPTSNSLVIHKGGTATGNYKSGIFPHILQVTLPNGETEEWIFGDCTIK